MERHYVTAVFSDLSDSTGFAHREDPEIVAQETLRLRTLANDVAAKHGGIVNQHHGDGIMTIFGLPRSREDDAIRALAYALELHAGCLATSFNATTTFVMDLHSGVDCGLVAVSKGDMTSGVYDAFGDALNRAARLSDCAQTGEIIVNLDTLGLAAKFFQTGPDKLVELKGIHLPIKSACLLARSSKEGRYASSVRRGLTTFSGRHVELQALTEVFQREGAKFRVVALLGEAGIGKSRLISQFLGTLPPEAVTLKGSCPSQLGASPLKSFLDCLRKQVPGELSGESLYEALDAYLELIDASLTGRTPVLHAALHTPSELNVQEVSNALRAWLVALARSSNSIVWIDDWQWADDASRELVSRLIEDNPNIVLFLAARNLNPEDPGLVGYTFKLAPLTESESEAAVMELLGTITEPGLLQVIQEQSGGNPLYLEELCQSVRARSPGSALVPELHPTLASLIEAKVADLSDEARVTAYVCAVLGDRIPTQMLINIIGHFDAVPELSNADILFASSVTSIRFKHGLTREVIYSVIPRNEARSLHAQAADVLRRDAESQGIDEPIEDLARHYAAAGDLELSLHYSSLAGDRALSANILDRSRHHYHNAIKTLRKLPKTPEVAAAWLNVASRLALASTYAPSLDVIKILLDASEVVTDEIGSAQLHYYLGWIYYALGDQKKALHYSRIALGAVQGVPGSEKLQAQLYACIGQSAAASCDYPLARDYLEMAVTAKKGRGKGKSPPIGWAYALSCLAMVEADVGNFERAYQLQDEALASITGANQSIEASIGNNYNVLRIWQGRWDEVIERAAAVRALCERYSLPFIFLVSRMSESYARWMQDRDEAALEVLRIATRQVIASEMQLYLSILCGWAADAMSAAGNFSEAKDFAARGLKAVERGDPVSAPLIYRSLHRCTRGSEPAQKQEASRFLELAYSAARERGSRKEIALTQLYEAECLLESGDTVRALQLASRAYSETTSMGMYWYAQQANKVIALSA